MPPTVGDPSLWTTHAQKEDFELVKINCGCPPLVHDGMILKARAEYDRLLSGIVSDL